MAQPALIFIPDISGFTRFVTRTEIQHASHIISELLDIIIRSNRLELAVSEIEGDAVLFYRLGRAPDVAELLEQTRAMFVEFHRFLKAIERDTVCRCGACSAASGLGLKFVAHYGQLDEVRVRGFLKLMGQDVILAHRLLKNALPGREYLLVTTPLLDASGASPAERAPTQEWASFAPYVEEIPEFGSVSGSFVPLGPLRTTVPDPPPAQPVQTGGQPLTVDIHAPIGLVHEFVTDMRRRPEWADGLRDVVGAEPVNRVGAAHMCVFDDVEVLVVTLGHRVHDDGFQYAERGEGAGVALVTQYRLTERDGVTTVAVRVSAEPSGPTAKGLTAWLRRIRSQLVRWVVRRGLARNLRTLKRLCEQPGGAGPATAPEQQPHAVGSRP